MATRMRMMTMTRKRKRKTTIRKSMEMPKPLSPNSLALVVPTRQLATGFAALQALEPVEHEPSTFSDVPRVFHTRVY